MPIADETWLNLVRSARAFAPICGFIPTGVTLLGPSGTLPYRVPLPACDLPGDSVAIPPRGIPGRVRDWNSGPEMNFVNNCRSVYHPDTQPTTFHFADKQRIVVQVLREAMEDGTWDVGQDHLLRKAESESTKLADLFKRHPAWGTLIIKGASPGTYRLASVREPE